MHCVHSSMRYRSPQSISDMTDHPWSASYFFPTAERTNEERPLSSQLTAPTLSHLVIQTGASNIHVKQAPCPDVRVCKFNEALTKLGKLE